MAMLYITGLNIMVNIFVFSAESTKYNIFICFRL